MTHITPDTLKKRSLKSMCMSGGTSAYCSLQKERRELLQGKAARGGFGAAGQPRLGWLVIWFAVCLVFYCLAFWPGTFLYCLIVILFDCHAATSALLNYHFVQFPCDCPWQSRFAFVWFFVVCFSYSLAVSSHNIGIFPTQHLYTVLSFCVISMRLPINLQGG